MTWRAISARPYGAPPLSSENRNAYIACTFFISQIVILLCVPEYWDTLLRICVYEPWKSADAVVTFLGFSFGRFKNCYNNGRA